MSSDSYASFEFYIPYNTDEERKWLEENIGEDDFLLLQSDPNDQYTEMEESDKFEKTMVINSNGSTEVPWDFDEQVKHLWDKLKADGFTMTGFVRMDCGGEFYRGDIGKDGIIEYESLTDFADYPVWLLRELKSKAEELKQR